MKVIKPAERLIVAADFPVEATGRGGVYRNVLDLANQVEESECVIKVNSILRARGYGLIDEIRRRKLRLFADLKLIDIGETLANDGALLRSYGPEFVTAMGFAGVESLKRLKGELPNSRILGVTILTTLSDNDTDRMFGCTVREGVLRFGGIIAEAGLDGFICAPAEAGLLRKEFGGDMFIATPGVRFADLDVVGDDQNKKRVMTPGLALDSGADAVVMGRPITQADSPIEAVKRALHEMASE